MTQQQLWYVGADVFSASLLELAKTGKGADMEAMMATAGSSVAYEMFLRDWLSRMGLPQDGATGLLVKSASNIMLKSIIESAIAGKQFKLEVPDVQDLAGGVLTVTASEKIISLWTPTQ